MRAFWLAVVMAITMNSFSFAASIVEDPRCFTTSKSFVLANQGTGIQSFQFRGGNQVLLESKTAGGNLLVTCLKPGAPLDDGHHWISLQSQRSPSDYERFVTLINTNLEIEDVVEISNLNETPARTFLEVSAAGSRTEWRDRGDDEVRTLRIYCRPKELVVFSTNERGVPIELWRADRSSNPPTLTKGPSAPSLQPPTCAPTRYVIDTKKGTIEVQTSVPVKEPLKAAPAAKGKSG